MAKDLPYFKFTVADWLTGDIVYESFEVQGMFINICAIYWQRSGVVKLEDLEKRFKNKDLIAQLTDRFFSVNDGFISVKFLDEQFNERKSVSITNSQNGKKGGRPKALIPLEKKPTANRPLTEHKAKESNIEKRREEKNIEENTFDLFFCNNQIKKDFEKWIDYRKQIGKPYKVQVTVELCYADLMRKVNNIAHYAVDVINHTISHQWENFVVPDRIKLNPATSNL